MDDEDDPEVYKAKLGLAKGNDPIFDVEGSCMEIRVKVGEWGFIKRNAFRKKVEQRRQFKSNTVLELGLSFPVEKINRFNDILTYDKSSTPSNLQFAKPLDDRVWDEERFKKYWESKEEDDGTWLINNESGATLMKKLNHSFFQVTNPKDIRSQSSYYTFVYELDKNGAPQHVVHCNISEKHLKQNLAGYTIKWLETRPDKRSKNKEKVITAEKTQSLCRWWQEHPDRHKISSIEFLPSERGGFVNLGSGLTVFNTWSGLPGLPSSSGEGPQFRQLDDWEECSAKDWADREDDLIVVLLIMYHMKSILCNDNSEYFGYLYGWLAHVFRNPQNKTDVGVVLVGEQGCGKTSFTTLFSSLFGRNAIFIEDWMDLFSQFSGSLFSEKVLVCCDELGIETRRQGDNLKNKITGARLREETKFGAIQQKHSYLNLLASTNNPDPIIGDKCKNRRWFILESSSARVDDRDYFKFWFSVLNHPRTAKVFAVTLMKLILDKFDVRAVPMTSAIQRQSQKALDPLDNWWLNKIREAKHLDAYQCDGSAIFDPSYPEWLLEPVPVQKLYQNYSMDVRRNPLTLALWFTKFQDLLPLKQQYSVLDNHIKIPLWTNCHDFLNETYKTALSVPQKRKLPRKNNVPKKKSKTDIVAPPGSVAITSYFSK